MVDPNDSGNQYFHIFWYKYSRSNLSCCIIRQDDVDEINEELGLPEDLENIDINDKKILLDFKQSHTEVI